MRASLVTMARDLERDRPHCDCPRMVAADVLITAMADHLAAIERHPLAREPAVHRHVLIVDDDPFILEMLVVAATNAGFDPGHIHQASSAEAAFAIIEAVDIRVASVDYNLGAGGAPNYTGIDVLRVLRDVRPRAVAVLIAGAMQHDVADEAREAGAAMVLGKRVDYGDAASLVCAAFVTLAASLDVGEP